MKKKLLFILLLGISSTVWAQKSKGSKPTEIDNSHVITINPFGNDEYPKKVTFGSTVKFKISNVNVFKVRGNVIGKPLDVVFDTTPNLNDILKPATENYPSVQSDSDKSAPLLTKVNILSNEKRVLSNQVKEFKIRLNKLKSQNTTSEKIKVLKREIEILTKKVEILTIDITVLTKKIDELTKEIEELKSKEALRSNFITQYKTFLTHYQNIIQFTQLEDKVNKKLTDSIFIKDTKGLKERITADYKVIYTDTNQVESKKIVSKEIVEFETNYFELKKLYEQLNELKTLIPETLKGEVKLSDGTTKILVVDAKIENNAFFRDEMIAAKKLYDTISKPDNTNKIIAKAQAGIDRYYEVKNEDFIVYTDAEQLLADAVLLTPTLKYANGKVAHEFKPLTIRTNKGMKADFSSGYLLSFIGDDNFKPFKDSNGDATIGVIESNKNKFTHSLGVLAHAYPRWVRGPIPAISAGASLATSGSLGFYGGGSLMFLEKNRLLFTFGYSMLKVNKLNTANLTKEDKNDFYLFRSTKDTEIKYDEVYKGAWFVGFTYNLSK